MTAALSPTPRADEGSAVGAALAALRAVAPQIQATCDGAFPQAGLSILRRTGVLAALASDQPSPHELMTALREVGRANLSLGRLFEGHVNGARLIDWYGTPEQRAQLAADLADGKVFGVWNTEPAPVTLIEEPGAARLQGAKSYATGAGAIDHAIITARTAEGGRQMVIVAADDPRRADLSTWRVSGMRGTVSGTYDLTDLPVTRATRLGQPGQYEREPRFSAGAWRFTAVQLGGAERILILLRDHLASSSAGDDPIQRARFGRALAAVRSAYLWVGEAANRAEAPEADHAAIAFVLMTRGVVEQAGLTVIEAAQRSVGTRPSSRTTRWTAPAAIWPSICANPSPTAPWTERRPPLSQRIYGGTTPCGDGPGRGGVAHHGRPGRPVGRGRSGRPCAPAAGDPASR